MRTREIRGLWVSLLGFVFSMGIATCALAQLPATANLQLWLKADADVQTSGASVTNWLDQSGKANHAAPDLVTYQPALTLGALNGLPVLTFDGTDRLLVADAADLDGGSGMTVFMVLGTFAAETTNYRPLLGKWDYGNPDGGSYYFESVPSAAAVRGFILKNAGDTGGAYRDSSTGLTGTPQILTFLYDGSKATYAERLKFFSNGSYLGDGGGSADIVTTLRDSQSPLVIADFMWGSSSLRTFKGQIAEIVLYNTALSATDQQTVENYLNQKWLAPPPGERNSHFGSVTVSRSFPWDAGWSHVELPELLRKAWSCEEG